MTGTTFAKTDALVGVIMGSRNDWETMKWASEVLEELEIPHERLVVSAHRTPARMVAYAQSAASRGLQGDHCGGWEAPPTCLAWSHRKRIFP